MHCCDFGIVPAVLGHLAWAIYLDLGGTRTFAPHPANARALAKIVMMLKLASDQLHQHPPINDLTLGMVRM